MTKARPLKDGAAEEGSCEEQERPVHMETAWEDTPVSVVIPHTICAVC